MLGRLLDYPDSGDDGMRRPCRRAGQHVLDIHGFAFKHRLDGAI